MIGTTISHYKILEKIGGGGMGVVYKAQDLKLDRAVALKFLPPELTLDSDARQRFVQEAKAASSLQHHNICTIHDIDQTADGQMFIVMDLYEGETLKSRIAKGKLKVEDATEIAIQIAQGLAEAHEHGIVHRDVKPANVLITKGGVAKVVDFGLAKLIGATKVTKTGSTLGTVAYMAPEQLQGSDVDARADIFSVGVLLYEMLTGKLPFRGDHEAALMYSITNEEPEPLQKHIPDVTSELIHVLDHALEKNPEERYQSMNEMVLDLCRLKRETARSTKTRLLPLVDTRGSVSSSFWNRKVRDWFLVGVVGIVVVVLAMVVLPQRSPRVNARSISKTLLLPFEQIGWGSLTADGNLLAFPAADKRGMWDVYVMHPKGVEPRRVTTESRLFILTANISPDENYIAFEAIDSNLTWNTTVVPSSGGKGSVVVENANALKWHPDGSRFAYRDIFTASGKQEIWSIKPDGSDKRLELRDTVGTNPASQFSCSWSPDGNSMAYVRSYNCYREIVIRNLRSGNETEITTDKKVIDEVIWTHQGAIVYSSNKSGNTNLWMIPEGGGESTPVTTGGGPDIGSAISFDGKRFLYYSFVSISDVWLNTTATGQSVRITNGEGRYEHPRLSPDRRRIFVSMRDKNLLNYGSRLYIIDLVTNARQHVSLDTGMASRNLNPSWSPDGRRIAFISTPVTMPPGSGRVCILDIESQKTKFVHSGDAVLWLNDDQILFHAKEGTYWSSLSRQTTDRFFEDSTWAVPVLGGSQILYRDFREATKGLWLTPRGPASGRKAQMIFASNNFIDSWKIDRRRETLYFFRSLGEIWKMNLATKKTARVASIRELMVDFDVSEDQKAIVFTPWFSSGRPNMIVTENLFE